MKKNKLDTSYLVKIINGKTNGFGEDDHTNHQLQKELEKMGCSMPYVSQGKVIGGEFTDEEMIQAAKQIIREML